jgi:hypothetical protein
VPQTKQNGNGYPQIGPQEILGVDGQPDIQDMGYSALLPPQISQEEIRKYLELEKQHKRFEKLKKTLIVALENGVEIEPGPFGLELEIRECRRLTQEYLFQALGLSLDVVGILREEAPLIPQRFLRVWRE